MDPNRCIFSYLCSFRPKINYFFLKELLRVPHAFNCSVVWSMDNSSLALTALNGPMPNISHQSLLEIQRFLTRYQFDRHLIMTRLFPVNHSAFSYSAASQISTSCGKRSSCNQGGVGNTPELLVM